jgi:hypothetical protein
VGESGVAHWGGEIGMRGNGWAGGFILLFKQARSLCF